MYVHTHSTRARIQLSSPYSLTYSICPVCVCVFMCIILGKVCENKRAFLRRQLVLLYSELLQQLPACDREDGLEQTAAEHLTCLVAGQAVVTLRHVTVAQPPEPKHQHAASTCTLVSGDLNVSAFYLPQDFASRKRH